MNADPNARWFPLFEFQDWTYQSTVVLPSPANDHALPGTSLPARKWAKGALILGQAHKHDHGYEVGGCLSFGPGYELEITARGALGASGIPATFEGTGTALHGKPRGVVYDLIGRVFPEEPIQHGAARVLRIQGAVWAIRGPDVQPEIELGGLPVGTIGVFRIERK
jgi:hypothetical protein